MNFSKSIFCGIVFALAAAACAPETSVPLTETVESETVESPAVECTVENAGDASCACTVGDEATEC